MTRIDVSKLSLTDIVSVAVPKGTAKARVVMLGDAYEHLDIDSSFAALSLGLSPKGVSTKNQWWLNGSGQTHWREDPRYAPAVNYVLTPVDE